MPYEMQIDRANPGCIVFVVDLSNSMLDGIAGTQRPKIDTVVTAINRFIQELITSCEKGEEKPRNYFDVGLIGYTTDANGVAIVKPLFQGVLAGRDLVSITELYDNPLEIEQRRKKEFVDDGAGGLMEVEREIAFPVWFRAPQPTEMFGTPMCTALGYTAQVVRAWIEAHPNSFPPLVINLTDGESTDGLPVPFAEDLKNLSTADGQVLLFNCHLSGRDAQPVFLPATSESLPDEYARDLFEMSSPLPEKLRHMAEVKGIPAPIGCKAMAFNADAVSLLKLLNVGTQVVATATLPPHLR
ncbi:MAG: VWA domain-containing protein [Gemmataceae bacterium]|nr:VWA domain-containing protein [Gemmata sp.]MDW8198319.1 VWA domain-containing protein [Gemmataceae bacterium]